MKSVFDSRILLDVAHSRRDLPMEKMGAVIAQDKE